MKKTLALSLLLVGMALNGAAQSDDFGLWTGVEAEWKVNKKVSVNLSAETRIEEKLKRDTRWNVGIGADWKIVPKFLKLGVGYLFINSYNPREVKINYNNSGVQKGYNIDEAFRRNRHRFIVDLTAKKSWGRFTFSLRERYQFTHNVATETERNRYRNIVSDITNYTLSAGELPPYFDGTTYYAHSGTATNEKEHSNKHYLRHRLGVSYNIKGLPLEPYVSFELSNNLSEGFAIEKRRWRAGLDYSINKQQSLTVGYVYNNSSDDDEIGNLHAIEIGYKYKF